MTATIDHTSLPADSDVPGKPAARSTGDRLYALDLLRFIAAAAVVGFHVIPAYAAAFKVDRDEYLGPSRRDSDTATSASTCSS